MKKKTLFILMLTLMLIASALTCLVLANIYGPEIRLYRSNYSANRDYATLLRLIDEMYIGEYKTGDVADAAMRAAVAALRDNWSYYLTPEEYASFLDSMHNRFTGIGVGVIIDDETDGMRVSYTYRGSPAETAGIVAGDVVTSIDGISLAGMTLDQITAILARPVGETAELTVVRENGVIETVTVIYDYIFTDPIAYEMLDGDVGYIDIANFDTGAADSFITAVDTLIEQGARAFIYDVRSNGGGLVSEVTRMLDYLLPEGEIFISVDREGHEEITMSGPEMIDLPAVVLVDRNSYSAAEFFAAMLKEYNYAGIVGEQTTGKSRSQQTEVLPGGGALHISTAQYLTKNRVSLYDAGGLTPDYQVALTDKEMSLLMAGRLAKEEDAQLMKAIEVLGR